MTEEGPGGAVSKSHLIATVASDHLQTWIKRET
jgi:hypothetical protein